MRAIDEVESAAHAGATSTPSLRCNVEQAEKSKQRQRLMTRMPKLCRLEIFEQDKRIPLAIWQDIGIFSATFECTSLWFRPNLPKEVKPRHWPRNRDQSSVR